jgi:simple sugar transport system permease protein
MTFITSFISQTMVYATVYTLTSLGIILGGRTGIFNVSAEGILLASASTGFLTAYLTGSWLMGFIAGALM